MTKPKMDYQAFCNAVQRAVDRANVDAVPSGLRYEISAVNAEGNYHVCQHRLKNVRSVGFDFVLVLRDQIYPDMTKEEYVSLGKHFIAGDTAIESVVAISVEDLYKTFVDQTE